MFFINGSEFPWNYKLMGTCGQNKNAKKKKKKREKKAAYNSSTVIADKNYFLQKMKIDQIIILSDTQF